jgi:murein DD-endopeptidase MepM/ murein hydrolase activator NlpD
VKRAVLILGVAALAASAVAATERVLWPLRGTITQTYAWTGPKSGHSGLDIAAPHGTPVYAALSGTVTSAGWNVYGYGNLVIVRGSDGRDYYYAHNSSLTVKRGQRVRQGQQIARVGSTGRSTGPHVHFEIRSGARLLNPLAHLPRSQVLQASARGGR